MERPLNYTKTTQTIWATCNCWSWLSEGFFFLQRDAWNNVATIQNWNINEIHFRCIFRNVFKSNIDNCGWTDIDCLWLHIYLYSRTERLPTVAVVVAARLVCCCVCCVCVVWFSFCTLLSCVGIFTLFVNISLVGFFVSELVLSLSAGGLNKMFWLFLSHGALGALLLHLSTGKCYRVAIQRMSSTQSQSLQHWITIKTSL